MSKLEELRNYRKKRIVLSDEQSKFLIEKFDKIEVDINLDKYNIIGSVDNLHHYLKSDGDIDESKIFLKISAINPTGADLNPNDTSSRIIRYRYEGPIDSKNRDFCSFMMTRHKLSYFSREDINKMSLLGANDEFGIYSIWKYKGSYGCRHGFIAYVFSLKETPTTPKVIVRRSAGDSSIKNN